MRKTLPIQIPVLLPTGFEAFEDDRKGQTREQLEYIGFYSQALFRMIKATIESMGDYDDREIQWKLGDMMQVCDIGASVAMAIAPLLDIFDEETPENIPNEIERVETIKPIIAESAAEISTRRTAEISSLALQLSAILNNQNLPVEIYNSVMESVGAIYNKGDNEILNAFESSPEYLKALLLAYAKREINHQ